MFVAGRQINVERAGKLVPLRPGDPCPEAATWPHDVLVKCMKVGQIVNVVAPTADQVAEAQAAAVAARNRSVAAKNAGLTDVAQPAPLQSLESGKPSTSRMAKAPAKKSTSSKAKKTAA